MRLRQSSGRTAALLLNVPGSLDGGGVERRLRLPMLRKAQFTAFLTKLRSSPAAASMRGNASTKSASLAVLSCTASVQQRKGGPAHKLFFLTGPDGHL